MSFLHGREGTEEPTDPRPGATPEPQEGPARDDAVWDETPSASASASAGAEDPALQPAEPVRDSRRANMLPGRERRRFGVERVLVRAVATGGVIGIGVVLGAILASSKVQGWIIGLAVAAVSVILSAILWSSRQL